MRRVFANTNEERGESIMTLLDRLVSRLTRRRTPESEDARLSQLAEQVALSREELREVRAKLIPPPINYDEEREMPY
jgi:predicted transposase YdaD